MFLVYKFRIYKLYKINVWGLGQKGNEKRPKKWEGKVKGMRKERMGERTGK